MLSIERFLTLRTTDNLPWITINSTILSRLVIDAKAISSLFISNNRDSLVAPWVTPVENRSDVDVIMFLQS